MNRKMIFLLVLAFGCFTATAQTIDANNNVVVESRAASLVLYSDYPFSAKEDFHADNVSIYRLLRQGVNTFYLPFHVTADEIGSSNGAIYTFKEQTEENAVFDRTDYAIPANTPFLMTNVTTASCIVFSDKDIVRTPDTPSNDEFVGNYDGTVSAYGKWGIGDDSKFVVGGEKATIKSFAAYLMSNGTNAKALLLNDEEATNAIDNLKDDRRDDGCCYTLSGMRINGNPVMPGVYVMNGRKFIVR
jgi:hypothetical protein